MFGKQSLLLFSALFLVFVCSIAPPFPALRPNSRYISISAEDYLRQGNFYFNQGKYELAVADYNRAIQINPGYVNAYLTLANYYAERDEHKLALTNYNRAVVVEPNRANSYYNRGHYYFSNQKYKLAVADYNRIIEIDPNDATAYSYRGSSYLNQGKYELAVADYQNARRLLDSQGETAEVEEIDRKLKQINK